MQFAQPNTRFLVATRDYGLPKRKHELEHGTLIIHQPLSILCVSIVFSNFPRAAST